MIGIEAVASYIPEGRIGGQELQERFQVTPEFVKTKTGMTSLARKSANEDTSDLCLKAFGRLAARRDIAAAAVEVLVVCTQNPDGHGLPNVASRLHAELGLPETCAAFDISLGCSGYVYGISIVKAFMESNGLRTGLLFTADPYSKILHPEDKNTSLLFGDAATATLLSATPRWSLGKFSFGSQGAQRGDIAVENDGRLTMNGRSVFTFSATKVPPQIEENLRQNGVNKNAVDAFLVHQGSRYIVDTIRERLQVAPEKVPFVAASYGNTVSSSIPLALEQVGSDARTLVLSGFGVGLSWATTVLRRN